LEDSESELSNQHLLEITQIAMLPTLFMMQISEANPSSQVEVDNWYSDQSQEQFQQDNPSLCSIAVFLSVFHLLRSRGMLLYLANDISNGKDDCFGQVSE
jgi:hypothetical protein